jgi:AraC-like DNA-binding protein
LSVIKVERIRIERLLGAGLQGRRRGSSLWRRRIAGLRFARRRRCGLRRLCGLRLYRNAGHYDEGRRCYVLARLGNGDLSLAEVAQRNRASPRYVQMLFERTGRTFSEFVLEQRLIRAARLLRDSLHRSRKVSDIAHLAGFNDVSYFHRAFRRRFAMTPSDMRNQMPRGDDTP